MRNLSFDLSGVRPTISYRKLKYCQNKENITESSVFPCQSLNLCASSAALQQSIKIWHACQLFSVDIKIVPKAPVV
jgi:hypothetical protein